MNYSYVYLIVFSLLALLLLSTFLSVDAQIIIDAPIDDVVVRDWTYDVLTAKQAEERLQVHFIHDSSILTREFQNALDLNTSKIITR